MNVDEIQENLIGLEDLGREGSASVMSVREAVGLVDDPLLRVSTDVGSTGLGVEVTVDGETVDPDWMPRIECQHDTTANLNTLVALIRNPEGMIIGRQLRIRARCSGCGERIHFGLTGTLPKDGIPGIVLTMTLGEDPPPTPDTPVTYPPTT